MKVWDTETNQQIGRSRVIPLECGDIDVRNAMEEAIKAQNVEVRLAVVSACTMQAVLACMHARDRRRIEHSTNIVNAEPMLHLPLPPYVLLGVGGLV